VAKRREPWLLLLVGPDAPQNAQTLMAELQGVPTVLSHVVAAERVDGLRWNLVLKDRTVVKLPDAGEAAAITQLAALQTSLQLLDRPVEVIDLRMPGRLVVRPYPVPQPESGKSRHT
jgi:cell division protein FtsQ